MRVAFFGSGSPMSTQALEAVAARAEVVAVVVPGRRRGRGWRRRLAAWRARRPLVRRAHALGLHVLLLAPGREGRLRARLAPLRPDLICVATFPVLIPPAVLAVAANGAIGLHPSLLPRRRGPDPLFWTYYDGDAETGVTVFRLDQGEDTGPVLAQERIPVPRGRTGLDLYHEMAGRGAALLGQAVADVAAGTARETPQDPALATRQPAPDPETCRVELAECEARWLWHLLGGIGAHRPLVRAEGGRPLLHGAVRAFHLQRTAPAGTVEAAGDGWRLHCRDGWVEVARAAWLPALRARLRALASVLRPLRLGPSRPR
jgi:methionyl-tRNA formyltransferase